MTLREWEKKESALFALTRMCFHRCNSNIIIYAINTVVTELRLIIIPYIRLSHQKCAHIQSNNFSTFFHPSNNTESYIHTNTTIIQNLWGDNTFPSKLNKNNMYYNFHLSRQMDDVDGFVSSGLNYLENESYSSKSMWVSDLGNITIK